MRGRDDPKTEDSVRVVSLPASALNALDTQRKRQQEFRQQYGSDYRTDLDLIFANLDGTPLKPDSVSASVSALCRRLKLPKGVSLHTLRHSHGSHLLAAGMEITAVSERLGHSSVRVTADVYSHAIRGGPTRRRDVGRNSRGGILERNERKFNKSRAALTSRCQYQTFQPIFAAHAVAQARRRARTGLAWKQPAPMTSANRPCSACFRPLLQPHRPRSFKLSTDPFFVEKVRDIVGLYLNPPDHAPVFCQR